MRIFTKINRLVGTLVGPTATLWLRRLRRGEIRLRWRRPDLQVTPLSRGYDAHRITRENLARVRDLLEASGLEFAQLPHWNPLNPRLVVKQRDLPRVVEALRHLPQRDGWTVEMLDQRGRSVARPGRRQDDITTIQAFRRIVSPAGTAVNSPAERVIIEPWRPAEPGEDRVDGGTYSPGTLLRKVKRRNTFVEYLTPDVWRAAQQSERSIVWDDPHLFEMREPIDIVYTWVDGNDPEWLRKKNSHLTDTSLTNINETAAIASRFLSRDELKYSLRSVEAYANWVNHIYLVTDGQTPAWLDTSHPKITVVDHRDIFADPSVLPVFNSHAIESQLHHIPGLSERYLYMNDDVFFMRPVAPELFFTSNGLSKFFLSRAPLDVGDASSADMPVLSAAKQGRNFMRRVHGRTVTNKFKHTPHPQLRSVLEDFEREYPDMFRKVSESKFRHPDDYSIASSLYHYHAYALGKAVEGSIRYAYVDLSIPHAEVVLDWWLRNDDLDVICINDTSGVDDEDRVEDILTKLLEKRFPIPSSFES